jgi:hypothetical protein
MSESENLNNTQFEDGDSEHVFTDIIQVVLVGDSVNLDIAIRSRKDGGAAKVSHTIHMTVPHFLRVTEVFNDLSLQINNQIKTQKKK